METGTAPLDGKPQYYKDIDFSQIDKYIWSNPINLKNLFQLEEKIVKSHLYE